MLQISKPCSGYENHRTATTGVSVKSCSNPETCPSRGLWALIADVFLSLPRELQWQQDLPHVQGKVRCPLPEQNLAVHLSIQITNIRAKAMVQSWHGEGSSTSCQVSAGLSADEKCCWLSCHPSPPEPQQWLVLCKSCPVCSAKGFVLLTRSIWITFPLDTVLSLMASCTFVFSVGHWHLLIQFFSQRVITRGWFGSEPFTCHMRILCCSSLLCHFCHQLARGIRSKSSDGCSSTAFGEHSYTQH